MMVMAKLMCASLYMLALVKRKHHRLYLVLYGLANGAFHLEPIMVMVAVR